MDESCCTCDFRFLASLFATVYVRCSELAVVSRPCATAEVKRSIGANVTGSVARRVKLSCCAVQKSAEASILKKP